MVRPMCRRAFGRLGHQEWSSILAEVQCPARRPVPRPHSSATHRQHGVRSRHDDSAPVFNASNAYRLPISGDGTDDSSPATSINAVRHVRVQYTAPTRYLLDILAHNMPPTSSRPNPTHPQSSRRRFNCRANGVPHLTAAAVPSSMLPLLGPFLSFTSEIAPQRRVTAVPRHAYLALRISPWGVYFISAARPSRP